MRSSALNFLSLFLSLSGVQSFGQLLPFQRFAIQQGLVSEGVTSLLQDTEGYLWIGTGEGISIFDGTTFRSLTAADGLPLNSVTCLSDSRLLPGTIFVGTWGGGIGKFSRGRFETLLPDSVTGALDIIDLHEDNKRALWCLTHSGVYEMIERTSILLQGTKGANAISVGHDNLLWVASNGELKAYDTDSHAEAVLLRLPTQGEVVAILQDHHETMWVTTSDSLLICVRDRKVSSCQHIPLGIARCIADDAAGNLWLGTTAGLYNVIRSGDSTVHFVRYTTENGLGSNYVPACLVDAENNLWLGNEGLLELSDWNIYSFPLHNVPVSYNNSKAVVDSGGHVWVVTGPGILEVWKGQEGIWRSHLHKVEIDFHPRSMPTIVCDRKGRIWIDTGPNIQVFSVGRNRSGYSRLKRTATLKPGVELPVEDRFFFTLDSRENLWLSTYSNGVFKIVLRSNPPVVKHLTTLDGLPHNDIRVIYADNDDNIWFGGVGNGVAMMLAGSDSIFMRYTMDNGLPDDFIRGIVRDKLGRIWVATRRNGIAVCDNRAIEHISMKDGLRGSAIWALSADGGNNSVWAGTQFGVQKIEMKTGNPVISRKHLTDEAVASLGTYRGQFVWFVTPHALTIYEYGNVRPTSPPPRVHITGFTAGGRERDLGSSLELRHDENVCVFEYVGITYRDVEEMRFQYRLSGAENEWQPKTSQRNVTYASLAPGSYTFEVRATNGEGMTTVEPARISFAIAAPFWRTWWFVMFSAVAVSCIFIMIIRTRVMRLLEIERLRSRIARDLHDEIGSNLSSIAMASELLRTQPAFGDNERTRLSHISSIAVTTMKDMKDIVWLIHPGNDLLDDLFFRMKDTARSILEGIQCEMQFPPEMNGQKMSLDWKRNVYLIYKESLTNVKKHSNARNVTVRIMVDDETLHLSVTDDGRGFDTKNPREGNGLANMRERAKLLGASLGITAYPDRGTSVILECRIT